jgi:amidophosphoribosyltransferase
MCGIVGIVSNQNVNQQIYDGLSVVQHRGQDAAGILTCEASGRVHLVKGNGLVKEVFSQSSMESLVGDFGIGHVRYPTAGCSSEAESQPFFVNSPYGIALAHNGNLTNVDELRSELHQKDLRHFNTNSDSEVLLNIFAGELHKIGGAELTPEKIFTAVEGVHRRVRGGYAVVGLIPGYGMFAFRDKMGLRPLVFGVNKGIGFNSYAVASESVALDALSYELERDVRPGEAIVVTEHGEMFSKLCAPDAGYAPCLFEYVYMARPDSIIDEISVYKARLRMGDNLGFEILKQLGSDHDIDVVIPIPDTSRTSAVQVAYHLHCKFREGFIKNRYIGRTFIMPGQQERKRSVRQKLNPIDLEFAGKNVLLVDDSIVRGTTAREIIQMARDSGAKNVYMASAAPAVRHPNVYGIDMPSVTELVAHGRTTDEIARYLGADKLFYLSLEGLIDAVAVGNTNINEWDASVFNGHYVTGDVTPEYLQELELLRSDEAKAEGASAKAQGELRLVRQAVPTS